MANLIDNTPDQNPIFLHLINKELHDALKREADISGLLRIIQQFSFVTPQILFCNFAQITEMFSQSSDVLQEISDLTNASKFVPHSEYATFDQFIENRSRQYAHAKAEHPAFFNAASKELKNLSLQSLDIVKPTTDVIQQKLADWIDVDDDTSILSVSESDRKILSEEKQLIRSVLDKRENEAITFDLFKKLSVKNISTDREGAIRRLLTALYIDNYVQAFNCACIWGVPQINHFDNMNLLTGLNTRFCNFILEKTGIDSYLKTKENYGRLERLLAENTEGLSYFRESYAKLSWGIDNKLTEQMSWHSRSSKIRSESNKIPRNSLLVPNSEYTKLEDLLLFGGENLEKIYTKEYNQISTDHISTRISKKVTDNLSDHNNSNSSIPLVAIDDKLVKSNKYNYFDLALIIFAFSTFILTTLAFVHYLDMSYLMASCVGVLCSIIIIFICRWYSPQNRFWRVVVFGTSLLTFGGLDLNFELSGKGEFAGGYMKFGNENSTAIIIVGFLLIIVGLFFDYFESKRSK